MRHFIILITFITAISFPFLPAAFAHTKSGAPQVSDFAASTLDGKSFALMDRLQRPDNKVLILTFFSTWCPVCDEDLKFLQRLQDQYGDQGLQVFCVFTGSLSRIKASKKYLAGLNTKLPVLLDYNMAIAKRYKVAGFPCTYAIDREGFLRIKCLGCSQDVKTKLERDLRSLLMIP